MNIKDYNFKGKRALVRVDFNVPFEDGVITDDTRIRGSVPTLKKILNDGGKLIIASHMGRPKKNPDEQFSLRQILGHVSSLLGIEVKFAPDSANAMPLIKELKNGEAILLENLRFYPEEQGKPRGLDKNASEEEIAKAKSEIKKRQIEFAENLASYADCYVNDAFGTAHRKHASTAIIADYFDKENRMFGLLMEKEVSAIKTIMTNPERPFTAIMGGSKVSSKIDVIKNLLNKVDNLIIGGGMTYTFIKAEGGDIGDSVYEEDKIPLAKELITLAKEKGVKLIFAKDAKIADKFDNNANTQYVSAYEIPKGWMALDIGKNSEKIFADIIEKSKTILWNGPAGVFEFDNFADGSLAVAKAIVNATKNGAYSLVGGGDSVACINKFGLRNGVSDVSTGGGALLEAIEGKVLPGISAIEQ